MMMSWIKLRLFATAYPRYFFTTEPQSKRVFAEKIAKIQVFDNNFIEN